MTYTTTKTVDDILPEGYFDKFGVFRWSSNDRIPPSEIIDVLVEAGELSRVTANYNSKVRGEEDAITIKAYIESEKNVTAEVRAERAYELRAAFGPGEEIVNVFTGEVTRT